MNFADVTEVKIPQGDVWKITHAGNILWVKPILPKYEAQPYPQYYVGLEYDGVTCYTTPVSFSFSSNVAINGHGWPLPGQICVQPPRRPAYAAAIEAYGLYDMENIKYDWLIGELPAGFMGAVTKNKARVGDTFTAWRVDNATEKQNYDTMAHRLSKTFWDVHTTMIAVDAYGNYPNSSLALVDVDQQMVEVKADWTNSKYTNSYTAINYGYCVFNRLVSAFTVLPIGYTDIKDYCTDSTQIRSIDTDFYLYEKYYKQTIEKREVQYKRDDIAPKSSYPYVRIMGTLVAEDATNYGPMGGSYVRAFTLNNSTMGRYDICFNGYARRS